MRTDHLSARPLERAGPATSPRYGAGGRRSQRQGHWLKSFLPTTDAADAYEADTVPIVGSSAVATAVIA